MTDKVLGSDDTHHRRHQSSYDVPDPGGRRLVVEDILRRKITFSNHVRNVTKYSTGRWRTIWKVWTAWSRRRVWAARSQLKRGTNQPRHTLKTPLHWSRLLSLGHIMIEKLLVRIILCLHLRVLIARMILELWHERGSKRVAMIGGWKRRSYQCHTRHHDWQPHTRQPHSLRTVDHRVKVRKVVPSWRHRIDLNIAAAACAVVAGMMAARQKGGGSGAPMLSSGFKTNFGWLWP